MDHSLLLRVVLILAAIFVLFALMSHYNRASATLPHERFTSPAQKFSQGLGAGPALAGADQVTKLVPSAEEHFATADCAKFPTDCMPRDRLTAEDLLPKDAANSKWAQVNPAGQGSVGDQNYLTAGYHVGIATQASTLRNPNYSLRPDPLIEQKVVSPWNMTTMVPDQNLKNLV